MLNITFKYLNAAAFCDLRVKENWKKQNGKKGIKMGIVEKMPCIK